MTKNINFIMCLPDLLIKEIFFLVPISLFLFFFITLIEIILYYILTVVLIKQTNKQTNKQNKQTKRIFFGVV